MARRVLMGEACFARNLGPLRVGLLREPLWERYGFAEIALGGGVFGKKLESDGRARVRETRLVRNMVPLREPL